MRKQVAIRRVAVTRYITPLREGGSLPAVVACDDDFKYVLKFRGAGHGVKMLISEFIGGEIARLLGHKVPELVFIDLDEDFGRTEADEEIQDLLRFSHGLNLGLHYLSGAINFDPLVTTVPTQKATEIIWLDAYLTNIDRTFRNTNMLMWHNELWLIDHGASLYFHHNWDSWETNAVTPFVYVKDHVLLPQLGDLDEVDARMKVLLTDENLGTIVDALPDDWLHWEDNPLSPAAIKAVYLEFLRKRRDNSVHFVNQAKDARKTLI